MDSKLNLHLNCSYIIFLIPHTCKYTSVIWSFRLAQMNEAVVFLNRWDHQCTLNFTRLLQNLPVPVHRSKVSCIAVSNVLIKLSSILLNVLCMLLLKSLMQQVYRNKHCRCQSETPVGSLVHTSWTVVCRAILRSVRWWGLSGEVIRSLRDSGNDCAGPCLSQHNLTL